MRNDGEPLDAASRVLAVWRVTRGAKRLRRFRHGSSGTSLVSMDGRTVVLKAWPSEPLMDAHLPGALERMEVMRARGVPIPDVLEAGALADDHYLLYAYARGRWPARVSDALLDEMVAVVDAERGAAGSAAVCKWQGALERMLGPGDPLFDISPPAVATHPVGRPLLEEARQRLRRCDPESFSSNDIVHGDFAPENTLAYRGRLAGVIDWERCRVGDAGLDLVGLLFDLDLGQKATPPVRRRLWEAMGLRMPTDILALYIAVYAVRYASWAIGSEMEQEVLALGRRLVEATAR